MVWSVVILSFIECRVDIIGQQKGHGGAVSSFVIPLLENNQQSKKLKNNERTTKENQSMQTISRAIKILKNNYQVQKLYTIDNYLGVNIISKFPLACQCLKEKKSPT